MIFPGLLICIEHTRMDHQVDKLDTPQFSCGLNASLVNDVVVHPNQGELISCDQAGVIRQWDLAENTCTLELVGHSMSSSTHFPDSI